MHVSALYYYPIKSCRGTACTELPIGPYGPVDDRAFMVVDATDPRQFITQRQEPRLALVKPTITGDMLTITADDMSPISRHRDYWERGERVHTMVHAHTCVGIGQGKHTTEWFSDLLHRHVRLLWMPNDVLRQPSRLASNVFSTFKFADGYPLLLTSEASLAALNADLPKDLTPFTMDRFRPNIVVTGDTATPWDEETWLRFQCGVYLHGVKLCDRCSIITTNQVTGERHPKLLAALLRIHSGQRDGKSVPLFGMNLIPETEGVIRVGNTVTDITFGPRPEL